MLHVHVHSKIRDIIHMQLYICIISIVLSDTEGEEESSESEEDESTVDSDEVAEKEEGPEGVEFNRGDEWEEEREDEDDHDDLRILAVSKDDKTGNQEYLVACIYSVHVRVVDILSLKKIYEVTFFGKIFFLL